MRARDTRRSRRPPDAPFILTASDAASLDSTHETAIRGPLGAWGDAGETGPEDSGSADSAGAVACGESSLRYTRPGSAKFAQLRPTGNCCRLGAEVGLSVGFRRRQTLCNAA